MLYELTPRLASLEEAFMELTADSVEYGDQASRAARARGTGPPASRTERAMTTAPAPAAPVLTTPAGPPALGFGRLLRAEWTKIRSVRSTLWSLFAFVVVAVGFSVLIAAVIAHDWNAPGNHPNHVRLLTDPTSVIYGAGFGLGQLAICVLGVMVITTEYTTGAIRASLLAVPKRIPMLAAKAVVCGRT